MPISPPQVPETLPCFVLGFFSNLSSRRSAQTCVPDIGDLGLLRCAADLGHLEGRVPRVGPHRWVPEGTHTPAFLPLFRLPGELSRLCPELDHLVVNKEACVEIHPYFN